MALSGIKVLELAGLAPGPFCGMILADFGAKVVRVDKVHSSSLDTMARGKRSICINLKKSEGSLLIKQLSKNFDVLIEPFRPGVMEKLGLAPAVLQEGNPGLIYVRLSGYGQTGPYCMKAGHDINYIATSGILSMLRRKNEKPFPPINLLADFAGGGLLAAFGIMTALVERQTSGKGQVIDASMVEGSAYVSSFLYTSQRLLFPNQPGENMIDSGAPFYDVYVTKDNQFVSVGALEPQFYYNLIKGLKLDKDDLPHQLDQSQWPCMREKLAAAIAKRTRSELTELFDDNNMCIMPVLSREEAPLDPHNKENESFFQDNEGNFVPNPAPRLSRTPGIASKGPQPVVGGHTKDILLENGFTESEVNRLITSSVVQDNSIKSNL